MCTLQTRIFLGVGGGRRVGTLRKIKQAGAGGGKSERMGGGWGGNVNKTKRKGLLGNEIQFKK